MAYTLDWLIPQLVLRVKLSGSIPATEVQEIADVMYQAIEDTHTDHKVHLLVDLRTFEMRDKVWSYSRLNLQRSKRHGWSIVVGDSHITGLVIAIFSRILNVNIRYSASLDEAMRFMFERDLAVAAYLQTHTLDLS